jgi:hypothetical protein
MGKPLRCRVRFHKWVKTKNEDGDEYRRCARCGQDWEKIDVIYPGTGS